MTDTTTDNPLLDTIDNAERIWPHNSHAVEDNGVEMAVLVALDKPTDAPSATSLLRRAGDHGEPVRSLFDAHFDRATNWSTHDLFAAPCDRCLRDVQPEHSLRVLAGATVVDVHCCARCRTELDGSLHELVWS